MGFLIASLIAFPLYGMAIRIMGAHGLSFWECLACQMICAAGGAIQVLGLSKD